VSDISIRLDGLLLLATLALTAVIFATVSLVGLILRRGQLAKGAAGLVGISLAAAGALVVAIDAPLVRSQSYDWIDWLILPWPGPRDARRVIPQAVSGEPVSRLATSSLVPR
jgi:hypothetical protein